MARSSAAVPRPPELPAPAPAGVVQPSLHDHGLAGVVKCEKSAGIQGEPGRGSCAHPASDSRRCSRPAGSAALSLSRWRRRTQTKSDRLASAMRVIATRGKGSCRGRQPHYRIRFVSRDPAVIGLRREESPSHARRTTASPRLRSSPAARTRRRPPRYSFARKPPPRPQRVGSARPRSLR